MSLKAFGSGKHVEKLSYKRPIYVAATYGQAMEDRPDFRKSPFSVLQYNFRFIYPDSYPAKFNRELAQDMILLYSKPQDKVFDPFVGSGEIIVTAGLLGRHGVGFDINPTAIEISNAKAADHQHLIDAAGGSARFEVADVRKIPLDDNSQDFCLTSPPFGTIIDAKHLKYSDVDGCLGNSKDYHDFLPDLRASIKEIYRVLKKNGVAAIEMRDRGKGVFIPLGAITMMQMVQVGFEPWAMFIVPWSPYSMWPYGPKEARKAIPSHAYLCVGRKTLRQGVKEMFSL